VPHPCACELFPIFPTLSATQLTTAATPALWGRAATLDGYTRARKSAMWLHAPCLGRVTPGSSHATPLCMRTLPHTSNTFSYSTCNSRHTCALGARCNFGRVYPSTKKCDVAACTLLGEGDAGVQPCHTPVHASSSPYFQHFQLLNLQQLPHPRSGGALQLWTGIPVYIALIPEGEKVGFAYMLPASVG
jgi:hypothetical protein